MWKEIRKPITIARVTVLESIRRKDPYVVLILGAAMVLGAGLFSRFGVEGLEKFVKDVGFTVITAFSIIICVVAAARQLPSEIQNRTLYPSLGKPISRTAFYFGKYMGVGLMSSAVVLMFFVLLRLLLLVFGISAGGVFYQALYLRVLSMWFIAAGVLCLSLFVTHAANVTISLLACMGMQIFAHSILYIHDELTGVSLKLAEALYWIAPHLELFDLSKKVIHGWSPIPMWVLAAMTLYGMVYAALFFAVGCVRFRRMPL